MSQYQIIKKSGVLEDFSKVKLINAVNKTAMRILYRKLTPFEEASFITTVNERLKSKVHPGENITVDTMHSVVEYALMHTMYEAKDDNITQVMTDSYRNYRNWKISYGKKLDEIKSKIDDINFRGDKSNANTDAAYVATKRCLGYNILNKELYQMTFMTKDELQACFDGYVYLHDMVSRRDTFNCCVADVKNIITNGFEMGNMWYNEANSLEAAFDVIGDTIINAASQQYGGFTIPNIDALLAPYAEKSYNTERKRLELLMEESGIDITPEITEKISETALEKVKKDYSQGFQGWEYKFNSVGSSRGDYPFIAMTFGHNVTKFGILATLSILKVRKNGQGKKGKERIVLFPKLIFIYDKALHGKGAPYEFLYDAAIECSSKAMYPDYMSINGNGYAARVYEKYGSIIHNMGCRSMTSPWFREGGLEPASDNDEFVTIGRFNVGVVSLNLPMILAKSREENKEFYEVLDYYLQMIRNIHLRTYEYLGNFKASCNPLMFCQGGLLGGNLNPDDKIAPVIAHATASFGVTALEELQRLYNGKSLIEDGDFAYDTMVHINDKIGEFKDEDHKLYSVYGTPAESLSSLQVKQFRAKYGIIENVSDREYFSNSFHCHVSEDITGIEKQEYESRFWDLFNGGKIQYVRYDLDYNLEAMATIVRKGLEEYNFYETVNLSKSYCDDCGHEELNMTVCSKCGSTNLTKIDRVCGYLGYSKINGTSRMNDGKMAEISDRKSM